jgi:hypothetical protein
LANLKFEKILLHKIYNTHVLVFKDQDLYYNEINLMFADENSNKIKFFPEDFYITSIHDKTIIISIHLY